MAIPKTGDDDAVTNIIALILLAISKNIKDRIRFETGPAMAVRAK